MYLGKQEIQLADYLVLLFSWLLCGNMLWLFQRCGSGETGSGGSVHTIIRSFVAEAERILIFNFPFLSKHFVVCMDVMYVHKCISVYCIVHDFDFFPSQPAAHPFKFCILYRKIFQTPTCFLLYAGLYTSSSFY